MERISVSRKGIRIGGGSVETLEPLHKGEILSHTYPHVGLNGEKHKGNMRVEETLDPIGFEAQAVCVQSGCEVRVEVKAT